MRLFLTLSMVAVAFSGCVDADADIDDVAQPLPLAAFTGTVTSPNFNPVVAANITITTPAQVFDDGTSSEELVDRSADTDANGTFSILTVPGKFPLTITHPDYRLFESTVTVPQTNVTLQLQPINVDIPYNEEFTFDGRIQCALEALFITPSCDALLHEYSPENTVFEDDSTFDIITPRGWESLVLDVRFDGSQHSTIEGLRVSAYTVDAEDSLGEYQRIHQTWADGDFSFRIDAGEDYGDNVPAPKSGGGDDLRFRFFPHGFADDTICTHAVEGDEDGRCFLGVGATQDLTFTATATLFIHEPAPPGWSTLGQQG